MKGNRVPPFRGALLGLIARRPMSGYDLTKAFDKTIGHVWSAKHSQIYPELAAMLADGLVKVRPAGTRGRKEYSLTPKGRSALKRWLTEAPPQPALGRNEALLRVFFLGYLPVADAQAFLRSERDRHIAQLELFLEDRATGRTDPVGGWTGGIALEAGIRYEKMMVGWCEWAIAEIERANATSPAQAR